MVPTAVNLSAVTGLRDTAGPIVSETDHSGAAATATAGTGPAEGFDALMNSLLEAMAPSPAVTSAALKTAQKSPPAASSSGPLPAADSGAADADLLALISGGAVPASAAPLPADGKTLPPTTGVAADRAAKAAAQDPQLDGEDADSVLSQLMQDGSAAAPSAAAAPVPTPATTDGAAAVPAGPADTSAASAIDAAAIVPAAMPVAAQPQAVSATTSSSDPSSSAATPSALSPAAAATAAPAPATPAVTAAAPVPDTATANKSTEIHLHPEPASAQSARPEPSLSGTTDGAATARDSSSQNGNPPGGQASLQEILAKIGGTDGAARGSGDSFRTLLQGADSGAAGNSGALVYTQPGAAAPARDAAVPSLPVHTPLRHPDWSDEVSQRVRWVIGNQAQSAELKINPPHLGPIEVRVSVDSDQQMSVTLSSQHALVRETLQDSVPRLRDLMSENGFGAVNVDVSQHSSSDGRKPAGQSELDAAMRSQTEAMDAGQDTASVVQRDVRGMVDFYA